MEFPLKTWTWPVDVFQLLDCGAMMATSGRQDCMQTREVSWFLLELGQGNWWRSWVADGVAWSVIWWGAWPIDRIELWHQFDFSEVTFRYSRNNFKIFICYEFGFHLNDGANRTRLLIKLAFLKIKNRNHGALWESPGVRLFRWILN